MGEDKKANKKRKRIMPKVQVGKNVCGNVNRLFDTKGMNRISRKPLKTRDSGTLGVPGIPCLVLGLCQGSTGAAVVNGHSGHESDLSVSWRIYEKCAVSLVQYLIAAQAAISN